MDETDADALRMQAYALYRRSNNIPMRADDRATIDRVGDLRATADDLIRRADEMDPPTFDPSAGVAVQED